MRAITLHIPTDHRSALREIYETSDFEELAGVTRADIVAIGAQLGRSNGAITASPVALWRLLMWAMNIAGDELGALCEANVPSRHAIEAEMRAIAWYLDALDVVGSLDFEAVA
jgi:hypothetical protein